MLIVDDAPENRYVLERTLGGAGFTVEAVGTGAAALERAAAFDLVVLDVNLPDLNGLDVAARLRRDPRMATIPILLRSAISISEWWTVHGLESGADAYLAEPTAPDVLVATARALIRARSADARASSAQRRELLAASERERARWAQELHDDTLQGLAVLRLSLSAARRAGSREALEEVLQAIVQQLEAEVSGVRAVIAELRPPTLDQFGVQAAIEALGERSTRDDLTVQVHCELAEAEDREGRRLVGELELALYRIVQEALVNARIHGRATHVFIDVIERDARIELSVRDDGVGFDPVDTTFGPGMLGMRERAQVLHGTFEITSAPGAGTTVRASLPARRRAGTELNV